MFYKFHTVNFGTKYVNLDQVAHFSMTGDEFRPTDRGLVCITTVDAKSWVLNEESSKRFLSIVTDERLRLKGQACVDEFLGNSNTQTGP